MAKEVWGRETEDRDGDADDGGGGAGRRHTGKLREQVTFDLKSGGRLAGG